VRLLESTRIDPGQFGYLGLAADDRPTLSEWIRRPEAKLGLLGALLENPMHGVVDTVRRRSSTQATFRSSRSR